MNTDARTAGSSGSAVTGGLRVQEVITLSEGDVEGASKEETRAWEKLDELIKTQAGWRASLSASDAVVNAAAVWRFESMDRVARIVGAYLIEHGHGEVWRALWPVLLASCDLWDGLDAYSYGDEVKFVSEAGHWRKDAARMGVEAVPA